jgi:hypothetical protein
MTTINDAVGKALDEARDAADPVERVRAVRRVVEDLSQVRIFAGNVFAVVTYEAQRGQCECGETFSRPAVMRRHMTDTGHQALYGGASYSVLAEDVGFDESRVQQLISKGRALSSNGGP